MLTNTIPSQTTIWMDQCSSPFMGTLVLIHPSAHEVNSPNRWPAGQHISDKLMMEKQMLNTGGLEKTWFLNILVYDGLWFLSSWTYPPKKHQFSRYEDPILYTTFFWVNPRIIDINWNSEYLLI